MYFVQEAGDLESVIERVQSWNRRKARMFTAEHITGAWKRLRAQRRPSV